MKKIVSVLLAAALMLMSCFAEGMPVEDDIPVDEEAAVEAVIPVEEYEHARELVRLLFVAATGTDEETEIRIRSNMTNQEQLERNDDNALYRRTALPWLMDVLTIDDDKEISRKTFLEHFVLERDAESGKREFVWLDEVFSYDATDDVYSLMWDKLVLIALDCIKQNDFGKRYIDYVATLTEEELTDELLNELTRYYFRLWVEDIDPEGLKEMNDDFAFWLYSASSPKVNLDYPVAQYIDNNDYYMHRLFNGEVNAAGTLILDYRNMRNLTDENTIVYGHNMNDGSMFGTLDMYAEQAFYESHPYMLVVSEDEIDLVEVYTAYETSTKDRIPFEINISEFLEELKYVKGIGAKTYLKIGIDELWAMLNDIEDADLKNEFIRAYNDLRSLIEYAGDDIVKIEFNRAFKTLWQLVEYTYKDTVYADFYNGIDEFMELVDSLDIIEADEFFYDGINDFLTWLKFVDKTGSRSDFIYRIKDIRPYDRILTLSTCTYKGIGQRYVVEGRILNTWFADEKWGDAAEEPAIKDEYLAE